MKLLIGGFLLAFSLTTQAITEIEENIKRACFTNDFENYQSFSNMLLNKNKNMTKEMLDQFIPEKNFNDAKNNLNCVELFYPSDGFHVHGFLITPKNMKDKKLPVIVYNRGGNGSYGLIVFGQLFFDLFPLAQEGFIVVASNYRGFLEDKPEIYGVDEFGGSDISDVHKLINMVKEHPNADVDNIFMYGASRGGMMNYMVARNRSDIRAMAVLAGPTDLLDDLTWRPEMENVYKARIPNYVTEKESELKKRSVLYWVNELPRQTPILLLHGEEDKKVNVKDSIKLSKRLDELHYKNKLIIYSEDDHSLRINREKARTSIVNWFRENAKTNTVK